MFERLIPEGCTCRWYSVRIPGEPHIPAMYEAEPDPLCPEHFPPRWKVACINWSAPAEVPHAVTYVLVGGSAQGTRYHATWADAIQWLNDHRTVLEPLAAAHLKLAREAAA